MAKRTKRGSARKGKAKAKAGRKAKARPKARRARAKTPAKRATARKPAKPAKPAAAISPRLNRARRVLEDTLRTPPSSLDLNRRGSAVRTGRSEMADNLQKHASMTPAITGGDVDVDVENAYFSGDETPGGDNPTPDQEVVDDIGKALGVTYQDDEELKASDKVVERDKHRWELDPASSEDYKDRK
jgi:hypothetical protein